MDIHDLNIKHVEPFVLATRETFTNMVGIEIENLDPTITKGRGVKYDIAGIIGITGKVKGYCTMSFPEDTILNIVEKFLGVRCNTMDEDVMDAVGELVNIVAGFAKRYLTEFDLAISIPTVIKGHDLVIKEPNNIFAYIIPIQCSLGSFDIGVSLKPDENY